MTEKTLADIGNSLVTTTETAPQPSVSEPSWYLADGIPGTGERPDYLEAKYKTVSEQAKAYKEAQKLLGVQGPAPETYDFSEVQDHINQDNPVIQDFIAFAKQNRLSQDAVSKSLKTWVDYNKSLEPNADEEIAKLGTDGMQKVTTIQNWIKNNLSDTSVKALANLPVKADVIKMLDEMRQLHANMQAKVPAGANTSTDAFVPLTVAEVENEMRQNFKRYETDPGYRAAISKKFEQAVG